MCAAVGKLDTRPGNDIADSARYQHFFSIGQCGNPGGQMYGYALRLLTANFTLTGMQSSTNTNA